MPFIGGGHVWLLLILLAIVLIIWGPGKLPEMGAGMGRAIREFRKATTDVRDQVGGAVPSHDSQPHADGGTAESTVH